MDHSLIVPAAADLVAIAVLAYGIYFRRHHRGDLLLAFVALNAGVFVVTAALTTVEAGMGLGLGLFGILSIIRLRSDQVAQQEIAYYFVALALGLLGGLHPGEPWLAPIFMAVLVAVVYVADHPKVAGGVRRQVLTLDDAHLDEAELVATLEDLLDARILKAVSTKVDLVRDITTVDVRYRPRDRSEDPDVHAPVRNGRATTTVDRRPLRVTR